MQPSRRLWQRTEHLCGAEHEKHECGEQHGPSGESGKAKGGDLDQRQQAQNDNRTAQDAEATSKAKQFGALNLALPIAPGKHNGPVCRSC